MPFIGEFEIDPESIVDAELPALKTNILFEVKESKREQKEGGNPYIQLELVSVDNPAQTVTHFFSPQSAKAIADRRSTVSWKKFLDRLQLPYSTSAADLAGKRFVATVKHVGPKGEEQAKLESVVGTGE